MNENRILLKNMAVVITKIAKNNLLRLSEKNFVTEGRAL